MTEPISLGDYELAQKALKDPKAAESMMMKVYPRIFQIARLAAGSRRQADDVAQIAAIEVLKGLNGFAGKGSLEAWAGRIAYRVAMRTVKKERQIDHTHAPLGDGELPNRENPEKTLSQRQLFEALLFKMESIPSKRRIPLLLHVAYGYTVNEVAELTESPRNTVKDRLKTAYRELKAILDEHPNLRAAMLEEIS